MYQAILWDMDGTLVDSEPLWEIATYEMSEAMGRRLTPELRAQTIGGTFSNTVRICAQHAGITVSEADYQGYRSRLFTRMDELLRSRLELNPGIAELLQQLHAAGTPMMVVTNTNRVLADPAIDAVGRHFFSDTICGNEVSAGKPDPEIYTTAAARLGVKPQQCLVFEDSGAGMTAASTAGCRVIGLPAAGGVPAGVVDMRDLHGSTSFIGVTPEKLARWFDLLATPEPVAVEE
ncbi:HAD family phosphatase [Corynebacterium sp. H127]|uniref:HAD family hydrolase n=1 Tax=Corynebacterium sp. H127 TaxID=3133418 RepID=UPI0030A98AD8